MPDKPKSPDKQQPLDLIPDFLVGKLTSFGMVLPFRAGLRSHFVRGAGVLKAFGTNEKRY